MTGMGRKEVLHSGDNVARRSRMIITTSLAFLGAMITSLLGGKKSYGGFDVI